MQAERQMKFTSGLRAQFGSAVTHVQVQVTRNMIMSLTLKMKGGLRVHCVPLGGWVCLFVRLDGCG